MNQNIYIKFQEHFKLYVLLKDKIIFEAELDKLGVDFITDLDNQPLITGGIRYYLLDKDRPKVDQILKVNKIIASTETITNSDYRDGKKYFKIYFIVGAFVIALMLLIMLIEKVLKLIH